MAPMVLLQVLENALKLDVLAMVIDTVAHTPLAMLLSGVKNAQLLDEADWKEATFEQLLGPPRLCGLSMMLATASPAGNRGDRLVLVLAPVLLALAVVIDTMDEEALRGAIATALLTPSLSLPRNRRAIVILLVPPGSPFRCTHGRLSFLALTLRTAMAPPALLINAAIARECLGRMARILLTWCSVAVLLLARLHADSIRRLRSFRRLQK